MDAALATRLEAIEQRLAALEAAAPAPTAGALGSVLGAARAVPVLDHGRRPNFWADGEVTELITRLHRRVSLKRALAIVADTFGAERAPSRSAVHRYWAHLDELARRPA
jgi:hypothetical protein